MAIVLIMVIAVVSATLSGCGTPQNPTLKDIVGESPPLRLTPSVDLSHRLNVSIEAPSTVRHGERMDLKLRIKNISGFPIQLEITGKEESRFVGAYDFEVTLPDGTKVWRWLHAKRIMTVATPRTLEPDEELVFSAEWDQLDEKCELVKSGAYFISGAFLEGRDSGIQTDRQQFIVTN